MFHQIYELMVLGMHPAISHSRRSQIRPLDRYAPDAPPAYFLIVRAEPFRGWRGGGRYVPTRASSAPPSGVPSTGISGSVMTNTAP